jgi:AcrR family transcriptional regulator
LYVLDMLVGLYSRRCSYINRISLKAGGVESNSCDIMNLLILLLSSHYCQISAFLLRNVDPTPDALIMVRTLDEAKRTAILSAAKAIIVKDGYAAAKISDIALEAKVAPGTLYLYFENKEALASAIGAEFFSRMFVRFATIIRQIEDPDGIITLVDWALEVAEQECQVLAMVRERSQDWKSKKEGRKRLIPLLAEALIDLMSRGVIRKYDDATMLAEFVQAIMRRVIMAHAIFLDENMEQLKAGAVEVLQHALFDDVTLAASKLYKQKQQKTPRLN